MSKTLRVKIPAQTVEIDVEAWTANYGVEGAKAIRADVINYAHGTVTEQFILVGVLAEPSGT